MRATNPRRGGGWQSGTQTTGRSSPSPSRGTCRLVAGPRPRGGGGHHLRDRRAPRPAPRVRTAADRSLGVAARSPLEVDPHDRGAVGARVRRSRGRSRPVGMGLIRAGFVSSAARSARRSCRTPCCTPIAERDRSPWRRRPSQPRSASSAANEASSRSRESIWRCRDSRLTRDADGGSGVSSDNRSAERSAPGRARASLRVRAGSGRSRAVP